MFIVVSSYLSVLFLFLSLFIYCIFIYNNIFFILRKVSIFLVSSLFFYIIHQFLIVFFYCISKRLMVAEECWIIIFVYCSSITIIVVRRRRLFNLHQTFISRQLTGQASVYYTNMPLYFFVETYYYCCRILVCQVAMFLGASPH